MNFERAVEVSRVSLPFDPTVREHWKPREPAVRTHTPVFESVLPLTECAEYHAVNLACIDDAMSPARRYDDLIARSGFHRETTAGIIGGEFLCVDDGPPLPDLK